MTATYAVERYRPEHKARVVELQSALWGSDTALNTAYFEWKYEQNPYLDAPLVYLLRAGDEIIGMRGFFGGCWEAGSPPRPSSCSAPTI